MNKAVTTSLIIVGLLFAGFMLFAPRTEDVQVQPGDANISRSTAIQESDIDLSTKPALYIGDPAAPVTLVEYGDFKCPACGAFHQNAGAQLRDEYVEQGLVNIEFRNFPVIGPDSQRAARGSYCAHYQGAFSEYHDRVYEYMWDTYYSTGDFSSEHEDILSIKLLSEIMKDDVNDVDEFSECIDTTQANESIATDVSLAQGNKIAGTPSFVANGQRVTGPSNYNTFKTLLDIQLQQ